MFMTVVDLCSVIDSYHAQGLGLDQINPVLSLRLMWSGCQR